MTLLSVLDQSPIRSSGTPAQAIQETLQLAQAADRLGYHRYWLAEHHSSDGLAGSSPEILIGQVAARTTGLRVGSGGVMLSHYSSLKVAENFRLLEALFPGRIDVGIGRAPGSDQMTSQALALGPGALGVEWFPRQISDLLGYLDGGLEPEHPYAEVKAMPSGPTTPAVWLLGSSGESAAMAAHFGTAFSFAHFINSYGGAGVVRGYVNSFRPSSTLAQPQASIGVFLICADTETEALRLAKSRDLFMARRLTGRRAPYPTVAEAEAHQYTPHELAYVEQNRGRTIVGAPEQIRQRLLDLGKAYQVDEFVVITITEDFASRLRSYELLAQAFAIEPRS